MLNRIKKDPYIYGGMVLLLLMSLLVAVYFFSRLQVSDTVANTNLQITSEDPQTSNDPARVVNETRPARNIILDSNNSIKMDSTAFTLVNNWTVTKGWLGTLGTNFKCNSDDADNCRIYQITNGDYNFYVANQPLFVGEINPNDQISTKDFDTYKGIQNIPYIKIEIVDTSIPQQEGFEPDTIWLVKQAYTCLESDLCVSSSQMPLSDLDSNKMYINKFQDFLKSIEINE